MPPIEWGWRLQDDVLLPMETDLPVAPDKLMKMVSCGCKIGCGKPYGCRKLGLFYTEMCSRCMGQTCNNTSPVLLKAVLLFARHIYIKFLHLYKLSDEQLM